jgi:nucleoside-diphosphate-sugar epimerase
VNILITGGSGFIGRVFAEQLSAAGHRLVNLDLVAPDTAGVFARDVRGDVRDPASVARAMDGCDAVLHLAAAHHDFGIERDTYFAVNEGAARILCQAMDDAGVTKACFFSSCAVYGEVPEPRREDGPTAPDSPYGASKLAGEAVFRAWSGRGDRRTLVIRPTVTFGPRNFANMYSLIRQIDAGRYLSVGAGTNIKSLSYVENIVDATLMLWAREDLPAFDVFNYIDKPDLTSRQIADAIYRALGRTPPSFSVPTPLALLLGLPFDAVIALTGRNLPVSTARIRKLAVAQTKFEADKLAAAGFVPRVPLEQGIERMVQWYVREGRAQRPVWHIPPAAVTASTVTASTVTASAAAAS